MDEDPDAATDGGADAATSTVPRTGGGETTDGVRVADAADGCPVAAGSHPAADFFSLLGRAHAMRVLALLATSDRDVWRFGEIEEELGVAPNTLSERLSELVEAGLLTRTAYAEIPPRVEYGATERARELDPVFRELRDWMRRHGLE